MTTTRSPSPWAAAALAGLALLTTSAVQAAGSIQSVCSASALSQTGFEPFAGDPAFTPVPRTQQPRCISTTGGVSSGITSDGPPGYVPGYLYWDAHSAISVDPANGISFSGYAQVNFNDVAPDLQIGSAAGTTGSFLDIVTITAPAGVSGPATLVIPLHVTGSATAAGTVVGPGIPHDASFTYRFSTTNATGPALYGTDGDTIGLSTTGETLACGQAACGIAPQTFDVTPVIRLPFNFGDAFYLSGAFGVSASFFLNAPPGTGGFLGGTTIADFAHTVTLGPATVVDGQGAVIQGVTIASDVDYLAGSQVPLPGTLALLAPALAVLGWRRRRR